ncbi:BLUF domain-containing protein [uncultured Tateyamaria sp.]|uniref:BLUF domain-containing protein n=1 Tax=uncultured Tateyamaria sp. TaxID=455651 RepID=UPI002624C6A1|nr:BLUF domain-containing protein [uncultured Tateyamaria sp.]
MQIVYVSQPFGFDEPTLAGILLDARRCNKRDDVTGALVCRHDIYLQLLEGPEDAVRAAYARICCDDRHAGVKELLNRKINSRFFANWAMLHDPAKTWIWTEAEIANAALDCAEPEEIIKVFKGLSERSEKLVAN